MYKRYKSLFKLQIFKSMKQILVVFFIISLYEMASSQDTQKIKLNEVYQFNLSAKAEKKLQVTIDQDIYDSTQLFISAQSTSNDPLQIPSLTVTSTDNFNYKCYAASSQFSDICSIKNLQLKANRIFTLSLTCDNECSLQVAAYLNDAAVLDIGESGIITSKDDFGLASIVQVAVPKGTQFTQIFVDVKIINIDQVQQGVRLYVNFGEKGQVKTPTPQQHTLAGSSTWDDGQGVIVSQNDLDSTKQNVLKCFIYAAQKMKVKFSTILANGTKYALSLNQQRADFTSYNQSRIYTLDLKNYSGKLQDQDIDITVTLYSGFPRISIGFSENFQNTKILQNNYIGGKVNTVITPDIRKDFGYSGVIYIKLQGSWPSTFKIIAQTFTKDYIQLQIDNTIIDHLEQNELQNFIYVDTLTVKDSQTVDTMIKKYVLKIQLMKGNLQLGLKRCKSLQTGSNQSCLLKDIQQIKTPENKKQFDQIDGQLERSYNIFQVRFEYDFSNCQQKVDEKNKSKQYRCAFQIVVFYQYSKAERSDYAITMFKRQYSIRLKQGYLVKDTVGQTDYHFYIFSLPSIDNVTSITFFVNVIQGDVSVYASTQDRFPTIFDTDTQDQGKIYSSSSNSLTLQKDSLKSTIYLSVYGFQNSDYTIVTHVKRQNQDNQNPTDQLTEIRLYQTTILTYELMAGQDALVFGFDARVNSTISLNIAMIQGDVKYSVHRKLKNGSIEQVTCKNVGSSCQFESGQNQQHYIIIVTGDKDSIERFSIGYLYPDQNQCIQYAMNKPLIITMVARQNVCMKYNLKVARNLQFLMSLTSVQILQKKIKSTITINEKKIQVQGHSRAISDQQQIDICGGQKEKLNSCSITIQISSEQDVQFQSIIELVNNQLALFQGVPQDVLTQNLTEKNSKNFYFDIFNEDSIKIMFTKQQNNAYKLIATFVQLQKYIDSKESVFPVFDTQGNMQNLFTKKITQPVSILQISSKQVKNRKCNICILLISVYRIVDTDSPALQVSSFTIQIIQKQTKLMLGQSKIDLVDKEEIHIYSLPLKDSSNDGIVYLSTLHQSACANLLLISTGCQNDVEIHHSFMELNKGRQYKVGVQGLSSCSFVISFFSSQSQVREITKNVPYQVQVSNSNIAYLFFYHSTNSTFKIIQNIQAGDSKTYIQPLKQDDKLEVILKLDLSNFTYNDQGSFADIIINNTDHNFCFQCYYLIAIKGNPHVRQEVIALDEKTRIPLRQNTIFKDRIKPNQANKQYQFHSLTTFNISLGLLYGKIKMKVIDPEGTEILNSQINNNQQFMITVPENKNLSTNILDITSQYNITITTTQESGFYIQIKKHNNFLRIKEGVPTIIELNNQTQFGLQFINLNSENNKTSHVNFLLQLVYNSDTWLALQPSSIMITQKIIDDQQKQSTPQQIRTQSQKSIYLQLSSRSGKYRLTLKINSTIIPKANISIILVKKQLNHLLGSHSYMFNQEGIYEIYDNNQNLMIEIFNCVGDIEVKASRNYSKLSENVDGFNQIALQHGNFGNHYVISTTPTIGEYFIQALNKRSNNNILYKMAYYQYQNDQQLPYRRLDMLHDRIQYAQNSKFINFNLSPVYPKPNAEPLNISQIQYYLYIAISSDKLQQYSQCHLTKHHKYIYRKKIIVQSGFQQNKTRNAPTFNVDKQQLKKKLQLNGHENLYVSAIARIVLHKSSIDNYPRELKYVYSISQIMLNSDIPYQNETVVQFQFYVLFVVFPCLIGSVFLFFACRYCWKRLYIEDYAPTTLIEQQQVGTPGQKAEHAISQQVFQSGPINQQK